ncbi:isoleucine biosynthesis protein, partial [Dionaea muscipula]
MRVEEPGEVLLTASSLVPSLDVYNDLVDLYNNVLLDYKGSHLVELATQAILESKHFAKEWSFVDAEDQYVNDASAGVVEPYK